MGGMNGKFRPDKMLPPQRPCLSSHTFSSKFYRKLQTHLAPQRQYILDLAHQAAAMAGSHGKWMEPWDKRSKVYHPSDISPQQNITFL